MIKTTKSKTNRIERRRTRQYRKLKIPKQKKNGLQVVGELFKISRLNQIQCYKFFGSSCRIKVYPKNDVYDHSGRRLKNAPGTLKTANPNRMSTCVRKWPLVMDQTLFKTALFRVTVILYPSPLLFQVTAHIKTDLFRTTILHVYLFMIFTRRGVQIYFEVPSVTISRTLVTELHIEASSLWWIILMNFKMS